MKMAKFGTFGSVSEGDADTIPEELGEGEDYFPPSFKEYFLKEQLKWWRYKVDSCVSSFGWVFWSEQDHEIKPSLSLDNWADFNPNACAIPKVEYNIRHALEKLIRLYPFTKVGLSLVQFRAATKTLEGRTRLTTQYQPFALGPTWKTIEIQQLCEYRMKMCSSEYNNCFYADAQSGEEQLGLPGRVFLHQYPESTPYVNYYYSTKEFPQRDLALRCKIRGSWAVPVFEHSSRTCVGVLEMASLSTLCNYDWQTGYFHRDMQQNLEEFGLRCFNGYQASLQCFNEYQACEDKSRKKGKRVKGRTHALQELKTVLRSVCQIHELPLAMAWVPCSACKGLRRSNLGFMHVEFCLHRGCYHATFLKVSKWSHLRKGLVVGCALSSPNVLYCSDISQFSLDEYPLVPYAQLCKLSGWFAICLQNVYTGNDIYVLEFFLSARSKDDENILTTLSFILGTLEKNFKTFRLASGRELGELMSVEVIYFHNGQKSHSVQTIQASRFLKDGGLMLLPQLDQPSTDALNNGMNVFSEEQNHILDYQESLQNGEVTMQLDSCDQPLMNPLNNLQNIVTAERNITVVTSSKESKKKKQEMEHKKTGVRIEVSLEDVLKCEKMKRKDAAKELNVSISTFKRACRGYGITRWPPRNIRKLSPFQLLPVENQGQISQLNSDVPSNQALPGVAPITPGFHDANMVTIKAKYDNNTIKFRLSLLSRFVQLQQAVAKRLNLEAGTYYVKYKDEEDELILLTCDEDLQDCMYTSRSLNNTSIVVLLELKQPITNLNY